MNTINKCFIPLIKTARWWKKLYKVVEDPDSMGDYIRLVKKTGAQDTVASILTVENPTTSFVNLSNIYDKNVKGTGLGKYLYNKAIYNAKTKRGKQYFASDPNGSTSEEAARVWDSISKTKDVFENTDPTKSKVRYFIKL
jgi:hypothetical protein